MATDPFNRVTNFSLHVPEDQLDAVVERVRKAGLKVGTAAPDARAADVARDAEAEGLGAVVVEGGGAVFFPGYLRALLPEHRATDGLDLDETDLSEMIRRIDDRDPDFHSERVNLVPDIRFCPRGHTTMGDPCPQHGVPTDGL